MSTVLYRDTLSTLSTAEPRGMAVDVHTLSTRWADLELEEHFTKRSYTETQKDSEDTDWTQNDTEQTAFADQIRNAFEIAF